MSIILRITGRSGRCRLTVEPTLTLGELKNQIADKFNVQATDIALALNTKSLIPLFGDSQTIQKLGLITGAELTLHTGTQEQSFAGSSVNLPAKTVQESLPPPPNNEKLKFRPIEAYLNSVDFDVTGLPLSQSYLAVEKRSTGATPLPPTVTLKHQAYRHIDHLEIMNVEEITEFVRNWQYDIEMLYQRAAFLIGYYRNDAHFEGCGTRAVCEALYEPNQKSGPDSVEVEPDELLPIVKRIAASLGLEIIGWVFTHLPRKQLISSADFVRMAKLQLEFMKEKPRHYTGYPVSTFVSLKVSLDPDHGGEASPDAFQISDLGLAMVRDGLIDENNEAPDRVHIKAPDKGILMPTVLESGRSVNSADVDWFVIRVGETAPKEGRRLLKRNSFPRNIQRCSPDWSAVSKFLNERTTVAGWEPADKYADFNFLVFVANNLGVESAEALGRAILGKCPVDPAFEEIINSLC